MKVKKLLIFLLLLTPLLATTPATSISAEASYYAGTDHWYEVISLFDTWAKASADATSKGGYLASMLSSEENAFAQVLVNAHGQAVYIGANDIAVEGIWSWVNGDSFGPYTNWDTGEPNDGGLGEDAGQMKIDGTWGDLHESIQRDYLIEYDSDPAPEFPYLVFPFAFIFCIFGVSIIFAKKRRS